MMKMANCSIMVKEELTKFFFSKIFIFGATLGLLRFVICYHFWVVKKNKKNSENQGLKFLKCSKDVKEHIFKEKKRKKYFNLGLWKFSKSAYFKEPA